MSSFGDGSGLRGSIATISDRGIYFRELAAEKFEFSIFPAVLVIIMLASFDFSLHEARKRLLMPVAIINMKVMVDRWLFIRRLFLRFFNSKNLIDFDILKQL